MKSAPIVIGAVFCGDLDNFLDFLFTIELLKGLSIKKWSFHGAS